MALDIPKDAAEVDRRAKIDVGRTLTESNPFLRNSWLGALITAFANRIFDFYFALTQANKEAIPDTATIKGNLERWAAIWDIIRLAATKSSGIIVFTGINTPAIPLGTILVDSAGLEYATQSAVNIPVSNSLAVTSITRSGAVATVTTVDNHNLASNVKVNIVGAVETEYNVNQATIIITGLKTFTYAVTGTPATPATGTITVEGNSSNKTWVSVVVDSVLFGASQNQDAETKLTLQTPITNVDNETRVTFGELGGGFDQETNVNLRLRLLDRIQNPIAHFNVNEITAVAKTVAGVTRVFVQEITPAIGQVKIFFMRDDDDDPIPSASEVTAVQDALETIRPANTAKVDVDVLAPTPVSTAYIFSSLSPDTASMRLAITASLEQFYAEKTDIATTIDEDAYRAAIFQTVDLTNGDVMSTFALSAPSGDIAIAADSIGTLGAVTYP